MKEFQRQITSILIMCMLCNSILITYAFGANGSVSFTFADRQEQNEPDTGPAGQNETVAEDGASASFEMPDTTSESGAISEQEASSDQEIISESEASSKPEISSESESASGDEGESGNLNGMFTYAERPQEESKTDDNNVPVPDEMADDPNALKYEDDEIKVIVKADEGVLPEGASLAVEAVLPIDEKHIDSYSRALDGLESTLAKQGRSYSAVKIYDISLHDVNGQEFEPNGKVSVTFEYKNDTAFAGSDIGVAHMLEPAEEDAHKTNTDESAEEVSLPVSDAEAEDSVLEGDNSENSVKTVKSEESVLENDKSGKPVQEKDNSEELVQEKGSSEVPVLEGVNPEDLALEEENTEEELVGASEEPPAVVQLLETKVEQSEEDSNVRLSFVTDSFSYYLVFGEGGSNDEPVSFDGYGWVRVKTTGKEGNLEDDPNDTSQNIRWGYYSEADLNRITEALSVVLPADPAEDTPEQQEIRKLQSWAYGRIVRIRLWTLNNNGTENQYNQYNYSLASTAQYFWTWDNTLTVEGFDIPGYIVKHTRMHTAWNAENGTPDKESDKLPGTYALRGSRADTLSQNPGAKNFELNTLDVYVKSTANIPEDAMRYIVRYVHEDGTVSDGYVEYLERGQSEEIIAENFKHDNETYSGMSIISGVDAITSSDLNAGTATITYDPDVYMVKIYVYYKKSDGKGTTHKGQFDKNSNGEYYTHEEGLYTDKSIKVSEDDDRKFELTLESWYVKEGASVGMVLDASGSMAWTAGTPTPLVLTQAQVNQLSKKNSSANNPLEYADIAKILDPHKTDNTSMGYNGYHYYIKDVRATVNEYVALGYANVDNFKKEDRTRGGSTSTYYRTSLGKDAQNNDSYVVLNRPQINGSKNVYTDGRNRGWYYVNSTGRTTDYLKWTGKTYEGLSISNGNYQSNYAGPLQFYVNSSRQLICRYYDSTAGQIKESQVYEKPDQMFTKNETLQDAVSQFGSILFASSPTSQIAMTRFSQNKVNSNQVSSSDEFTSLAYLPLLNWTSDPKAVAAALNQSVGSTGGKSRNDNGVTVYEYGLTGQTRTWTGVQAFADTFVNGSSKPRGDNSKYLIIFTDGKDTNGDATANNWGTTGTAVRQLKNQGYTIVTVLMKSQAMGNASDSQSDYSVSKKFLQGLASNSVIDNTKLYFESDSDDPENMVAKFREIAGYITRGLNGYVVRDYIDPRFDVVNEAGSVISKLSENGTFQSTTFRTHDGKQAELHYDSNLHMFYVVWKDAEIPATTVDSEQVKTWSSRIWLQAKEDFLGGNDILTNGNDEAMNMVYKPKNAVSGNNSVSGNNVDTSSQVLRKVFPQTAADPGILDPDISDLTDIVYLGETVTREDLEFDGWYYEYLIRKAKAEGKTDSEYYVKQLKNKGIGEALELDYYYLSKDTKDTNAAGTPEHKQDKVGKLKYEWVAVPGIVYEDDGSVVKTKVDSETVYQLKITYTPLTEAEKKPGTQSLADVGEPGRTFDNIKDGTVPGYDIAGVEQGETNITGNVNVSAVDGEIKVRKKVLLESLSGGEEFTFTLTRSYGDAVDQAYNTFGTVYENTGQTDTADRPLAIKVTVPSDTQALTADGDGYVILESGTVSKLPIGTYKLTEAESNGFELESVSVEAVNAEFDCASKVESNTVTFYMGQVINRKPANATIKENEPYLNAQIGQALFVNRAVPVIELVKVNYNDATEILTGAAFKVYSDAECTREVTITGIRNVEQGGSVVSQETSGTEASVGVDGCVTIKGLSMGVQYYLKETEAPEGYYLINEALPFTITSRGVVIGANASDRIELVEAGGHQVRIKDSPIFELPSTGGPGNYIFTIVGVAISAIVILNVLKDRRRGVAE